MNLHCVYVHKKSFFFFSVSNNDIALKGSLRVCLLLEDAAKIVVLSAILERSQSINNEILKSVSHSFSPKSQQLWVIVRCLWSGSQQTLVPLLTQVSGLPGFEVIMLMHPGRMNEELSSLKKKKRSCDKRQNTSVTCVILSRLCTFRKIQMSAERRQTPRLDLLQHAG